MVANKCSLCGATTASSYRTYDDNTQLCADCSRMHGPQWKALSDTRRIRAEAIFFVVLLYSLVAVFIVSNMNDVSAYGVGFMLGNYLAPILAVVIPINILVSSARSLGGNTTIAFLCGALLGPIGLVYVIYLHENNAYGTATRK